MTPQEFDDILRRTAQDRKLSGPERSALGERLAGLSDQQAAAFRARAFELARQGDLLDWLEDVVKLLHPVRPAAAASEALFTPHDDVVGRIIGLFTAVKRTADVCVFTITDDRITDAMLRAHRRGVRMRVITDDQKALDLGADVGRIAEAGVPLVMDRTEAHMHHKFAVFDGALLANGSYNWTRSAQGFNSENLVVTAERALVVRFVHSFDRLWQQLGGGR